MSYSYKVDYNYRSFRFENTIAVTEFEDGKFVINWKIRTLKKAFPIINENMEDSFKRTKTWTKENYPELLL